MVDNNWKKTTFMKSVPMSTYLVCFAVHQFTYTQRISKRGIPVSLTRFQILDTSMFAVSFLAFQSSCLLVFHTIGKKPN